MTIRRFAPFVAFMSLVPAGCQSTAGFQMSSSTPAPVSMAAATGRAGGLAAGAGQSFWLWRDDDGLWHLRSTAPRAGRNFQGLIRPLPGTLITDVKPLRAEGPRDHVASDGKVVAFHYWTRNTVDGFDFRIQGDGCVEFDLRIDGDGDPNHIRIGKSEHRPRDSHFLLCP